MTIYGYARVSTNGQDLTSQEAELTAAGCVKVYREKVSGAQGEPQAEIARSYDVSQATISRLGA